MGRGNIFSLLLRGVRVFIKFGKQLVNTYYILGVEPDDKYPASTTRVYFTFPIAGVGAACMLIDAPSYEVIETIDKLTRK